MIRYFGLYANAHRGKVHKSEEGPHKLLINHLILTFVRDKPPPPHIAYQEVLMAAEAGSEYF